MGISRQAHYQWQHRRAQDEVKRERTLELVKTKRLRQPRLGTRKLHHLLGPTLVAEGCGLGRDALFDLLRWNRLLVPTKRAYHKTTNSHHGFRRHPNLLKAGPDQVSAEASEQVWVADITYLPTRERCAYLSLITDAYSRKIVGYHVHDSLHTAEVSQALKMALNGRQGNRARPPHRHWLVVEGDVRAHVQAGLAAVHRRVVPADEDIAAQVRAGAIHLGEIDVAVAGLAHRQGVCSCR